MSNKAFDKLYYTEFTAAEAAEAYLKLSAKNGDYTDAEIAFLATLAKKPMKNGNYKHIGNYWSCRVAWDTITWFHCNRIKPYFGD